MKTGRVFQMISSMAIAFVIRCVLIALLGFPVLFSARFYAALVCIVLMAWCMFRDDSSSGSQTVREERIVDGQGKVGCVFDSSRYPGIKLIDKSEQGNIYTTEQGELITTRFVTSTIQTGKDDGLVIGVSAIIMVFCLASLLIGGVINFFSNMTLKPVPETGPPVSVQDVTEEPRQEETVIEEAAEEPRQEETVTEEAAEEPRQEETVIEETAEEQGEYRAELVDYGIFKDGRGIASADFVFPDSDARYLTNEDLKQLTLRGVNYAKNELFARHGRKFQSKELQDFFGSRDWYEGLMEPTEETDDIIEGRFNGYEQYNCDLLYRLEDSKGMYKLDE